MTVGRKQMVEVGEAWAWRREGATAGMGDEHEGRLVLSTLGFEVAPRTVMAKWMVVRRKDRSPPFADLVWRA